MSMAHLSLPNSIPKYWLYIFLLFVSESPILFDFFWKQLDAVHVHKVIHLFLWFCKFAPSAFPKYVIERQYYYYYYIIIIPFILIITIMMVITLIINIIIITAAIIIIIICYLVDVIVRRGLTERGEINKHQLELVPCVSLQSRTVPLGAVP